MRLYMCIILVVVSVTACSNSQYAEKNVAFTPETISNNREENTLEFLKDNQGALLDSATTAMALSAGLVEMNPIISGACGSDPVTVGICAFGGKKLMEAVIEASFADNPKYVPGTARKASNTVGYLAGCSNIAVLAGATGPAGLAIGLVCATTYWKTKTKNDRKASTPEAELVVSSEGEPDTL